MEDVAKIAKVEASPQKKIDYENFLNICKQWSESKNS